jgi:hypothetical protein
MKMALIVIIIMSAFWLGFQYGKHNAEVHNFNLAKEVIVKTFLDNIFQEAQQGVDFSAYGINFLPWKDGRILIRRENKVVKDYFHE